MSKNEVAIPVELAKKLWGQLNSMFQFPRQNPEIWNEKLVGTMVNPVELAQDEMVAAYEVGHYNEIAEMVWDLNKLRKCQE